MAATDDDEFIEARLVAHTAAHLAAALARVHAKPLDDYGHVALTWNAESSTLESAEIPAPKPFRIDFSIASLAIGIVHGDSGERESFDLAGKCYKDGVDWLVKAAESAGFNNVGELPEPKDWPSDALRDGDLFPDHLESKLAELEGYYTSIATRLESISRENAGAKPVRCWPHHFDIATLILLEPDKDPEEAKSINVGMSPGDGSYAMPYWYVVPYPTNDSMSPDALTKPGFWHTDGYLGAILNSEAVAGNQQAAIDAFIAEAFTASHDLLQ